MDFDKWQSLVNPLLGPSVAMELVSSENVTVCRFRFDEVKALPAHAHPQEQITLVLEGEMVLQMGGSERVVHPGEVALIPGDAVHAANIVGVPFRSLDIFHPVRHDFLLELKKIHGSDAS